MSVARLAMAFLQSALRFQADPTPFPFERLPPELRLQVYREALIGAVDRGVERAEFVMVKPFRKGKKNSQFRFEGLPKGEWNQIDVGLLTANRLLNTEAVAVLYQLRTFDFGNNLGYLVRFLRGLSEHARRNVRGIAMELRCGPDVKGRDNAAAWGKACTYIHDNVNVKELTIFINIKITEEFKSLKWVKDLIKIKKLTYLSLEACQHDRNGPVGISASYKEGSLTATRHCASEHLVPFFEYLRDEMLE